MRIKVELPKFGPGRAAIACAGPWGRCESKLEHRLGWAMWALPDLRMRFVSQHWILRWRVDFAFQFEKVVVEADGAHFHGGVVDRVKDGLRERGIEAEGWRVIRFDESRIRGDANGCAVDVLDFVHHQPLKRAAAPSRFVLRPASTASARPLSSAFFSYRLPSIRTSLFKSDRKPK